MSKRFLSVFTAVVLLFSMTLAVGARGSFGFSGGVNVGSLDFTGVAKGLGSDALSVTFAATAIIDEVTCTNQGGTAAAGVNTVVLDDLSLERVFLPDSKGRLVIESGDMVLEDPDQAAVTAAACKNGNWIATWAAADLHWGEAVVTMVHSSRTIVLTFDCSASALIDGQCELIDTDEFPTV